MSQYWECTIWSLWNSLFHCLPCSKCLNVQTTKWFGYIQQSNNPVLHHFPFPLPVQFPLEWHSRHCRAFIKGCWVIKSVHICRWDVSNSKTNCLVHTQLDLCDTVGLIFALIFAHLLITLPLFNVMQEHSLKHTKGIVCTCTFSTPCVKMGLTLTL